MTFLESSNLIGIICPTAGWIQRGWLLIIKELTCLSASVLKLATHFLWKSNEKASWTHCNPFRNPSRNWYEEAYIDFLNTTDIVKELLIPVFIPGCQALFLDIVMESTQHLIWRNGQDPGFTFFTEGIPRYLNSHSIWHLNCTIFPILCTFVEWISALLFSLFSSKLFTQKICNSGSMFETTTYLFCCLKWKKICRIFVNPKAVLNWWD